ncbi:MAG: PAS domain S-box protein [Candidatus Marinimicrobia bacterium]|nr:PAS domain S-box protein [Candidatus Neomarinimicrobiota bacterium]
MKKKHTFQASDTLFILDNLNTAVFRTSPDNSGSFIDVNPAFLKIFGYEDKTQLAAISVVDLYVEPGDRDSIRKELKSKGHFREREFLFKRSNGKIFPGRVSSVLVKDDTGQAIYIDGVVDDITMQKQQFEALHVAEVGLKQRQLELIEERRIFFSGPVIQIHWPMDESEPLIYISENVKDILGYEVSDFTDGRILYPSITHREDLAELQEKIRTQVNEGSDVISVPPYRLKHKNGGYIWVQDYGYIQKDESGKATMIMGYIYDVTELQESHRKIAESELRYRGLVENSPTGIIRIDVEGNILEVNTVMVNSLGSPSREATMAFNIFTFKPLQDAGIAQKFQECIRENKAVKFTSEYTSAWEKTIYFQVVIHPIYNAEQQIIGAQANMEDISGTYQAELATRALERTQLEERNIFLAGPIMIIKWDMIADKALHHISDNVENILGYTVDEMLSGAVLFVDIMHPEDAERCRKTAQQALDQGLESFETAAYRIRCKDGHYIWVNDHSTIIRDENGEPKNISGVVYDISHIIQAEERIKLTEQTYQELFNAISEAVFIHDPDTSEILDVNETMLRMYGYKRDEVIGTDVQKFSAASVVTSGIGDLFKLAISEGHKTFEWEAIHKSGKKFWVEVTLRPAVIHGKDRMLANVRNISGRKEILTKLEKSLQEKDLLLREVHHRVKNNMQVINSLLNLQAEYTQDEHLFEIFGETQNRIRTMALIHERLFKSKSMDAVDFDQYIESLIYELINFYTIDQQRIRFHQDIDQIKLNINKAIPCGLIVNELITNVLKYAFPDNGEGDIWVSVKAIGHSAAEIIVRDNGVGLNPSLDFETTQTMGLRITRILTEQLEGKMEIDRTNGTSFKLRFNLQNED